MSVEGGGPVNGKVVLLAVPERTSVAAMLHGIGVEFSDADAVIVVTFRRGEMRLQAREATDAMIALAGAALLRAAVD